MHAHSACTGTQAHADGTGAGILQCSTHTLTCLHCFLSVYLALPVYLLVCIFAAIPTTSPPLCCSQMHLYICATAALRHLRVVCIYKHGDAQHKSCQIAEQPGLERRSVSLRERIEEVTPQEAEYDAAEAHSRMPQLHRPSSSTPQ